MADGKAEVKIAKSPDEVWDLVGNFGGLADWMPGVDSCELDGDVRKLQTMGLEIHEQLMEHESPMPLDHHLATMSVEADGDGSLLTWAYEVRPDEMAGAIGPIYDGSAQAVKTKFEG